MANWSLNGANSSYFSSYGYACRRSGLDGRSLPQWPHSCFLKIIPSSLPAAICAPRARILGISQSMKSPRTGALCFFAHGNAGISSRVSLRGQCSAEIDCNVLSSQAPEHLAQRGIFNAMPPLRDLDARAAPRDKCSKAMVRRLAYGQNGGRHIPVTKKAPPKRGFSQQTEEGVTGEIS